MLQNETTVVESFPGHGVDTPVPGLRVAPPLGGKIVVMTDPCASGTREVSPKAIIENNSDLVLKSEGADRSFISLSP
jgi:hypothetical protein